MLQGRCFQHESSHAGNIYLVTFSFLKVVRNCNKVIGGAPSTLQGFGFKLKF